MLMRNQPCGVVLGAAAAVLISAGVARAQSDQCNQATQITAGTYTGTTVGFTNDGAAGCGESSQSADAWYRFTAATTCPLRIRTCGSSYDTVLSVHSACPGTPGNGLACNDDTCALGSTVIIEGVEGESYLIRIAGWQGATGSYLLEVACEGSPEPLDDCSSPQDIGPGTVSGSTAGASNDGAASCGDSASTPDHWYRYTPSAPCLLRAQTCGSAYDTVLSIHTACPDDGGLELDCNDDTCALGSVVEAPVEAGIPYLIRVSGWAGATGDYTLDLACTPYIQSDSCTAAAVIDSGSFAGTTTGATPDGMASCGDAGDLDVWFMVSPEADCSLSLDTCGSHTPVVLSVHSACPGTPANEVACSTTGCNDGVTLYASLVGGQDYWVRVGTPSDQTGTFILHARCAQPGADVFIGELTTLEQYGRLGDTIGCALDSPLCNAGTEPLDWFANPDPRHPFMIMNMYRVAAGGTRVEQIGQSWAKHGFGAAQDNACGLGCTPFPNGTRLGVGCSDTYSAGLNAEQTLLGPRTEINPWTGSFTFEGSHFVTPQPAHTPISHRLQIRDADLDPALHPGAAYFVELYIPAHDDTDHMNSVAWEPVAVSGTPGGTWNFNIGGAATQIGPAINGWPASTRTTIPETPVDDGRCILATRVTDNGDGTWHYEFALYNHDMDRGVRTFSVPARPATTITNIGFSAPRSHGEAFHNNPWQANRTGSGLTWSTGAFQDPPASNPLRWGTMHNFWFDADATPVDSAATLGLYKPGAPSTLAGATPAPSIPCPADFNRDGAIGSSDITAFLSVWFSDLQNGTSLSNFDANPAVTSADITAFLSTWFAALQSGC
ncbi:MAG: hypothetical protein H7Y88_08765 [Phycisphaerales bacterium]|nr:hypothetical protein [Phycisphaerales bacterium]